MKIKDLKELINSTAEWDEYDLTIEITPEEGVLYPVTPTKPVRSMNVGFDWDSGKFIFSTR